MSYQEFLAKKKQPPYQGYEPYDVLQVFAYGRWTDYATIRDLADAREAVSKCSIAEFRIVGDGKVKVEGGKK